MEKIKEFFVKNKATIISVLSALLTFAISLSKIDMGTKVGVVISILIVVIPFIISVISGDDMETNIKLLVNAITLIQAIIRDRTAQTETIEDNAVVGADYLKEFTEEEIKDIITKGL